MANDSATGGYLAPTNAKPLYGEQLVVALQAVIVGISGIPGNMVRPRWQPEPPNLPAFGTDWVALGVTVTHADTFPYVHHNSDANGSDEVVRNESLELACSFYGPNSAEYAATLRDGLFVGQNREALSRLSIALIETGDITHAPELVNERWRGRNDITIFLRRQVRLTYAVLNILSGQGTLETSTTAPLNTP